MTYDQITYEQVFALAHMVSTFVSSLIIPYDNLVSWRVNIREVMYKNLIWKLGFS
jgi:hypothetical protein